MAEKKNKMGDITASAKTKDQEGGTTGPRSDSSFNLEELRELADLVSEHGFTDFEFENENIRVRLSKANPVSYAPVPTQTVAAPPPTAVAAPAAETTPPSTPAAEDLFKITSPIVGTFYRSAGPDKEPYVKVGSQVTPETVVCIVEAMKLMNEIQAETSGEIVEIFVENGQPVEYGQPLFGIRK